MIAGLRRSGGDPRFTNRRAADKNVIERGGRETFGRWQCDTSARRHIFPAPRETIFDQIAQRLLAGKFRVFERSIPIASDYKRDVAEFGVSGLHRFDVRTQLAH